MKKAFKLIALVTALIMAASLFAACTESGWGDVINALSTELNATDDPNATQAAPENTEAWLFTDAPTDAPAITSEPVVTDEPIVTDEPAPTASANNDFEWIELEIGVPVTVDFDFDGQDDTVTVKEEPIDDYTSDYTIEIIPGGRPENTLLRDFEEAYWCNACLLNPDPGSHMMYLVTSFDHDSDDTSSLIHYAIPDSGEIVEIESDLSICQFPDGSLIKDGFVTFQNRTEIMGTQYLTSEYLLTPEGPSPSGDYYYYYSNFVGEGGPSGTYVFPEDDDGVKVIKKISVSLIDEEGERIETYKLRKGDRVWPVYTDCAHFVVCQLADGRLVQVNFFIPDDESTPHMDGYPQETFFDVIYCDRYL